MHKLCQSDSVCMTDFSMKSSGQWFPMRSFSADAASSETAESWEPKVEGLSKVILGGWSWAQVTLFSIFLFFVVEKRNTTYSNAPVCWHTLVCTHTHILFLAYIKNENTVQNVLSLKYWQCNMVVKEQYLTRVAWGLTTDNEIILLNLPKLQIFQ